MGASIKKLILSLALCAIALLSLGAGRSEAADAGSAIAWDAAAYSGDAEAAQWISSAICYASAAYQVDPLLIAAVMETESHFNFQAVSPAGAIGLMQLMPGTAAGLGVNPWDPLGNVLGGALYLRQQLNKFGGWGEYGVTYAVAAYNAGPSAVSQYGGVPPYPARPQVPIPEPGTPVPAAQPKSQAAPTVQGVLTGEGGSAMAIMGDGQVVGVGDDYQGNRIAYIGGDGIAFDNGHRIGYK